MKFFKNKFFVALIIAVIIFLGLTILRGSEDTWICKNGGWIKHGNPSAEMPTSTCNL